LWNDDPFSDPERLPAELSRRERFFCKILLYKRSDPCYHIMDFAHAPGFGGKPIRFGRLSARYCAIG
jgi:hypothetical protein